MTRLGGWAPRGPAARRQGPAGHVEDRDFPCRLAQRPHRCALLARRAHQRRALPRLRRTLPRADAETLKPGDVAILDNLGSHKGRAVRKAIRDVGARLVFCRNTPPTSTPSSRSSPSSKLCCERRKREAMRRSLVPAAKSSPSTCPLALARNKETRLPARNPFTIGMQGP